METRHLRFGYEEALSAKKQLLSAELNMLQTLKRLQAYKNLRKREHVLKTKLKINLISLRTKLNLILSTFPEQEGKVRIHRKKTRKQEKGPDKKITQELEDIRAKLAQLK